MSDKSLPSLLDRHWAESVLAIGAIVIAAVSLWVAYDSQRTNQQIVVSERQLVAENAWPFVEQYYSTVVLARSDSMPKGKDQYIVTNAGIGPAKIEMAELTWRGKAYPTWQALAQDCCGFSSSGAHVPLETSGLADSVLRPGQTVAVMGYPRVPASSATWKKLEEALQAVRFKICYCSVFNQCWLTHGPTLHPQQVKRCPVAKVPYNG